VAFQELCFVKSFIAEFLNKLACSLEGTMRFLYGKPCHHCSSGR
jgi:hypothetical protein